jgi:phosphohistidine phosphatase
MKVLLIRHAHAIDQDGPAPDEARHLTARGRALARKVGERLRAEGIHIDVLLTSPLVRAVQTAELVAIGARYGGEIEALPALEPGASPRKTAAKLAERGEVVAAVGHEPGLSVLAALLAGRASHPPLKKAQVVIVDGGKLVGSLDPDEL